MTYPLIGLAGYAFSGKDTFAEHLTSNYDYARAAFGDQLKTALYALNPYVQIERLNYEPAYYELQAIVDELGWDDAKKHPDVRRLLQRIGTEVGRNVISPAAWLVAMNGVMRNLAIMGHDRIVISDVRFQNELEYVRKRKGVVIWVDRARTDLGKNATHASEGLTSGNPLINWTIDNNGTIEEFHARIDSLMNYLKED